MSKVIDARGRSCPEPVIMTKNELEKGLIENLDVLVDTHVAVENITRFAKSRGFNVNTVDKDNEFRVNIKK